MTKKILKADSKDCIGCDLCSLAANRMCKKFGINGSPVKILGSEKPFSIHLDPSVNTLDIEAISNICPKRCFNIEEVSDTSDFELMLEGVS